MGTPRERDEESEAVDDHLRERGGISIPCSPRALVCGKYQGTGFSFHFRRRCDEGTYLQFDLAQDNMDLISVVMDMTYPYGLTKDKEKPYEGILRQTLVSHENSCHTWIGFGQGCISCGPCSCPELTEDHVLPSAYVEIFRTAREMP